MGAVGKDESRAAELLATRSGGSSAALIELIDLSDIFGVIYTFEEGVRCESIDLIASVFSDDASLDYPGVEVAGIDAVRAYYEKTFDPASPSRRTVHTFDAKGTMTPFLGNPLVAIDGDRAHCESMTLAIHSGIRDGQGRVVMRAVTDSDDLVRTGVGWRISHRKHVIIWGFDVPATTPARP